jgi:hypothetical protein
MLVECTERKIPSLMDDIKRLNRGVECDALLNLLSNYSNGNITVDECYGQLTTIFFSFMLSDADLVERVWATFELLLGCILEPERRANLQLRYLRDRPFIITSCCNRKHCFKCKSKDW